MLLNPHKDNSEIDIDYWRDRVLSLEVLVGELLTKNQAMRFILEAATRGRLPLRASDPTDVYE